MIRPNKKQLAALVVLAVMMCALPVFPGLIQALLYEEVTVVQWLDQEPPILVLKRRTWWSSGQDWHLFDSQVCNSCADDLHDHSDRIWWGDNGISKAPIVMDLLPAAMEQTGMTPIMATLNVKEFQFEGREDEFPHCICPTCYPERQ